jgi:hypothetical protein
MQAQPHLLVQRRREALWSVGAGVEFPGEENRCRFEGLVFVAQPLDFCLQLVDFGLLGSGPSGSGSGL